MHRPPHNHKPVPAPVRPAIWSVQA
jgi:hypothetical protein